MALAHYQTFIHPRGLYCYKQDFIDSSSVRTIFSLVGYQLHSTFPMAIGSATDSGTMRVSVLAVIGDHILASAAWIYGSPLNGMDLYDSCVVFLKTQTTIIALPAARVLSQNTASNINHDVERSFTPRFRPRSTPNTGQDLTWWYWIPCGNNKWLQFRSEELKISGERSADIMTDVQITKKFQVGDLNISLSKAEDLQNICTLSMKASQALVQLLN